MTLKVYLRSLLPGKLELKLSRHISFLILALPCLAAGPLGCTSDETGGAGAPSLRDILGEVERGPQLALASTESMTIAWRSFDSVEPAVVYWPENGLSSSSGGGGMGMEHVIALVGLSPDTNYFYQLQHDGEPVGDIHSFATASRDSAAPLRFAVLGDFGCGCPAQYRSVDVINATQPDLVLTTGDNVYFSGTEMEVRQNYFIPMASLINHVPVYPSLGNHDLLTGNGAPFLDSLYLPTNDANGSERYYSFDRGNCHFIALEATHSLEDFSSISEQAQWLVSDLQRTSATWIICYFHQPLYSDSSHGDAPLLQRFLAPIFDEHGVDLVLSGHDHTYQRTYPMRGGEPLPSPREPNYIDPEGTIYVVTGAGGATVYPLLMRSQRRAAGQERRHVVIVDVVENELTLSAVDHGGVVFDRITITKTVP